MSPIDELKFNLLEINGGARVFSDVELEALLIKNKGDVDAASYDGLIMKAKADGMTLPDGTKLDNNRQYWLTLASLYRKSGSKALRRADDSRAERRLI